jgi:hypothetical protein
MLAADAKGLGPKGRQPISLVGLDPAAYEPPDDDLYSEDEFDDEVEDDSDDDVEPPRRGAKASSRGKPKRGRATPKPKWQQQLAWTGDPDADDAPQELASDKRQTREVWYVLDSLSDANISKPLLLLYQREVRATGKLGKLKPFSLRPADVDRVVTGEDAEILKLLLGYQSVEDEYYGYSGYSPRVSEVVLPKGAQQFLLPKLAATGRLARVEPPELMQPDAENLRPLSWDEGPPWRFRLDIARDDQRQRWVLSGQLYREGGACVPLDAALAVFKQGIVLFDDRLGPLETGGSAGMIEALRKTPRVEVPYKDRWELLRRLWQLPQAPEMNLPDELRAEEVTLPPQGRLKVDKPERYDPYRLPGRVDFLYGDKAVSARDAARGIVDDKGQRIILRDRQRERELAASLAARHVQPMQGWRAERYDVSLSSNNAPAVLEALINEGWVVEAQGYHIRRAGTFRMNVASGVDWFDLSGTIDFDGLKAELPEILEALRRGQNYVRLSDGSRGLLPQEWLARLPRWSNWARPRTAPSASARRRHCCWTRSWRRRSRLPSMPLSRGFARTCGASTASARPTNREASAANCGTIRRRASAGLVSWRSSASAAAWPTTWAWARRSRCWPCCNSAATDALKAMAAAKGTVPFSPVRPQRAHGKR